MHKEGFVPVYKYLEPLVCVQCVHRCSVWSGSACHWEFGSSYCRCCTLMCKNISWEADLTADSNCCPTDLLDTKSLMWTFWEVFCECFNTLTSITRILFPVSAFPPACLWNSLLCHICSSVWTKTAGWSPAKWWPGVSGCIPADLPGNTHRHIHPLSVLKRWIGLSVQRLWVDRHYPDPSSCTFPSLPFLRWFRRSDNCWVTFPALLRAAGRGNCSAIPCPAAFPPAADPRYWCYWQQSE